MNVYKVLYVLLRKSLIKDNKMDINKLLNMVKWCTLAYSMIFNQLQHIEGHVACLTFNESIPINQSGDGISLVTNDIIV